MSVEGGANAHASSTAFRMSLPLKQTKWIPQEQENILVKVLGVTLGEIYSSHYQKLCVWFEDRVSLLHQPQGNNLSRKQTG